MLLAFAQRSGHILSKSCHLFLAAAPAGDAVQWERTAVLEAEKEGEKLEERVRDASREAAGLEEECK